MTEAACRHPYGNGHRHFCRCHELMGNDFCFLPIDRCLDRASRKFKIEALALGGIQSVPGVWREVPCPKCLRSYAHSGYGVVCPQDDCHYSCRPSVGPDRRSGWERLKDWATQRGIA